jgi:methionine-gamma-lyase
MAHDKGHKPATGVVGYGYEADWSENSVKPPIFVTSTFSFENCEDGERFFRKAYHLDGGTEPPKGLIYSRLNNPNLEILEDRLTLFDGGEAAAVFSSGMSAISTTCMALCEPGDYVLFAEPVYGGTEFLFENVLPRYKIETVGVTAGTDAPAAMERVIADIGRPPKLIFVESPCNPTMVMTDIAKVRAVADGCAGTRPIVAVDNTFLGPVFQHPLKLGADLSLYSLTKFVGGHSDLIAGAVVGRDDLVKGIKDFRTILGTMSGPFTAWLATRSLETVALRMERQARTAETLAEMLALRDEVVDVVYPALLGAKNPQRNIYKRQCTGPGGIISFDLGTKARAFAFLDALEVATLAVSLGGNETLAEHPGTMTHADVPPERQKEIGITVGLVRVSVGIEDPIDLVADFEQALDGLQGK